MKRIFTDIEINGLLKETKNIDVNDYNNLLILTRQRKQHLEKEVVIKKNDGNSFIIIIRKNKLNIMDFSVILGYLPYKSNSVFRLRRYNGKSHRHTNKIEKSSFYDFHIHTATERYQLLGMREDHYAESTSKYSDVNGAVNNLFNDCIINIPTGGQSLLF